MLIEESIRDYDAFVAVTNSTETNILACVAAKGFGVPRTIAEVEDPEDEPTDPTVPSGGGTDAGNTENPSGGGSGTVEQISISTSVNDDSMGTVTGAGTYDKGATVTLIATANEGYRFVSWGDEVTDNPRTVTAKVNGVTYSAIFEKID